MPFTWKLWLVIGCFAFNTVLQATKVPDISLSLGPGHGFAPMKVSGRLTIPPNSENSEVCVEWDSGDTYDLDCWTLNGDQAPKTTFYSATLKKGDYDVRGILYRGGKVIMTSIIQIKVLEGNPQ